jgi:FkbM family methyltransferase
MSMGGMPIAIPPGTSSVWLEIGVSSAFDFATDLPTHPGLFLIGVEPRPERSQKYAARWCRHKASCILGIDKEYASRATLLERACTSGPQRNVTFYVHSTGPCNSLLPTEKLGDGRMAGCLGKAQPVNVASLRLHALLHALLPLRVPLLKIDVQGNEWPCLESAGSLLRSSVDNLFIEVSSRSGTNPGPPSSTR